jgi:hypothetical protein
MEQRQGDVLIGAAHRSTKVHEDQKDYTIAKSSECLKRPIELLMMTVQNCAESYL